MKKIFLLILVISFSLIMGRSVFAQQDPNNPVNNPTNPAASSTINIIGDSLTVGSQDKIQAALPNANINPAVSRQWSEGLSILQDLASSGNLAPIVIFALGTNGPTDDAGVDQVVSLAGSSKIVLMTIFGTTDAARASYGIQNAVIRRAAAKYPDKVIVADWYSIAAPHPEWFASDPLGVHPTTSEGKLAFAQVLTNAVSASSTNNFSSTSSLGAGSKSSSKSNVLCIQVGNPTTEKPAICNQPSTTTGAINFSPAGPRPEAPAPEGDLQVAIQRQFGITMLGFDDQHFRWAWEKFWEVSGTNFNTLVKGAVIQTTSVSNTQQVGCPPNTTALIGQFPEETAFKHILMHELGHAIRNCAGRERAQESAFIQANKAEGGVSYYARNAPACTRSDNVSEDYAEMIAFYLNNGTPVASYLKCYQQQQFRLSPQEYPLHYKVVQDVLGPF